MLAPSQKDSTYDTTVENSCKQIDAHEGPLMLDLDETLYLRNSTEDFIDTAVPGPLAWMMLKLLDVLKPWRFTGGWVTRDVWRVRMILIFFPWTMMRWRSRVQQLAERHGNQELIERVQHRQDSLSVVSLGFEQIIAPLVHAMGLKNAGVIAMSPWDAAKRAKGKLAAVRDAVGDDTIARSLLVTDSMDDADILAVCDKPLRVIWPDARFVDAFGSTYIPGQYLSRVKRPGQQYLYKVIIRDDFVFWVLASIGLALNPLTHVLGLGLLAVSFWAIYEWGYVDNDQMGAKHEKDPHLSDAFLEGGVKFSTPLAWLWAGVFGVAAIHLLHWPLGVVFTDYLAWAGVLLSTWGCYLLYNRLNKPTRIWLYGLLQLLRIAAFIAVVPVTVVGAVALCAYTIARWIPYLNYRTVGGDWVEGYMYTIRLMMFIVITGVMAGAMGLSILWQWTALALLGWNLFKARHELKEISAQAHRIDRQPS
jgi:hypothetical protein